MKALRLLHKGRVLLGEFSSVNASIHSSSIAYYTFLSLVPALALCISLVSLVGISEQDVVSFFAAMLPDTLSDLVTGLVRDAFNQSGIAFSLSTVTLLWSASKGIKALRGGLNAAFAVDETRGALVLIVISIVGVVVLGIMVAGLMYIVFSGSMMRLFTKIAPALRLPSGIEKALHPLVILAAITLIVDVCYAYLPAGSRRPKAQLPGALLTSITCVLISFGFGVYVDQFANYTVLYGSIATVAILLIWIYLISLILIVGGFINHKLLEGKLSDGDANDR